MSLANSPVKLFWSVFVDPTVIIKEWAAYKGKSPHTPELVEALPFREWTCPNLKKLWLGKAVEDKNRRMRAFLACMRSDTPAMLNPANVPTPLMVLCCVLRWESKQLLKSWKDIKRTVEYCVKCLPTITNGLFHCRKGLQFQLLVFCNISLLCVLLQVYVTMARSKNFAS